MKKTENKVTIRYIFFVFLAAVGIHRVVNDILHLIDAETFPITNEYYSVILVTILFCSIEYANQKKRSGNDSKLTTSV